MVMASTLIQFNISDSAGDMSDDTQALQLKALLAVGQPPERFEHVRVQINGLQARYSTGSP